MQRSRGKAVQVVRTVSVNVLRQEKLVLRTRGKMWVVRESGSRGDWKVGWATEQCGVWPLRADGSIWRVLSQEMCSILLCHWWRMVVGG